MANRLKALCAGLLLLAGGAVAATLPEPIGYVMSVEGEAFISNRGQTIAASTGQAVIRGARLITGADGALGLTLSDATLISLGPRSELTLEHYQFAPARRTLRLSTSLQRGTLSLVSGEIARLNPRGIEVHTPDGTLQVRQAHLLLRVGG